MTTLPPSPPSFPRRTLVALLAALLCVGALLRFGLPEDRRRAAPARPLAALDPAPLPAAKQAGRPATGFLAGDVLRYAFDLETSIEKRLEGQPAATGAAARLQGSFVLRAYDGSTLGFEMVALAMETSSSGAGMTSDLTAEFAGEALVQLDATGEVVKVVFPEAMSAAARGQWKDLLLRWRVAPRDAREWDAAERDRTGTYTARYVRLSGNGVLPIEIERTRGAYDVLCAASGRPLRARGDASGTARFLLDPLPLLSESSESFDLVLEDAGMRLLGEARFRCVRTAAERDPSLAGLAAARRSRIGEGSGTRLHETEIDRRPMDPAEARRDARERIETARAAIASDADGQLGAAMNDLLDLLAAEPAALDEIRDELASARCDDVLAALLSSAAAESGAAGGQALLREVIRAGAKHERRLSALVALSQVEDPDPETQDLLVALHKGNSELSDTALLILGAAGNRLRSLDAARHATVAAYVEETLAKAEGPEALVTALGATANLGPASVPARAREALADENELLREVAVRSLVRVGDAEADALLLSAARGDAAPFVRRAALETLAARDAAGLGGSASATRDLFAQVAENDADAAVRTLAGSLLAQS